MTGFTGGFDVEGTRESGMALRFWLPHSTLDLITTLASETIVFQPNGTRFMSDCTANLKCTGGNWYMS
jgi:hypothetical protein